MKLTAALQCAVAALETFDVRYALIGGLAVSARAEPRFTRDVDLVVAVPTDASAEALLRFMLDNGWQLSALVEQAQTDRLGTARLIATAAGGITVDLAFASSGVETEIVAKADVLEVAGVHVPVATSGHLVALKLLARDAHRPHDHGDLIALADVLQPTDVEDARTAVRLITERGFHRDRDLDALLDEYLKVFRRELP